MAGNCDAANGAGRSNAPTLGWGSSGAYWFVTSIGSASTWPSSISLASGSHYENVFETRCAHFFLIYQVEGADCLFVS